MFSNTLKCDIQSLSIETLLVLKVSVFRALYLINCYVVNIIFLYKLINLYVIQCFVIKCRRGRQ